MWCYECMLEVDENADLPSCDLCEETFCSEECVTEHMEEFHGM